MVSPKKAVDTLSLVASALSLFKTLGVVFAMSLLEWAKMRAAKAEDKQAVAETNLKVNEAQHAVDQENSNKSDRDVVRDYLDSPDI